MKLDFTKLHGCGNDYLFVDGTSAPIERAGDVSRIVADRHTGVGSDGLIIVYPSETADFRMEMYNADGSRGNMCGNGIRSFAKFVSDRGMTGADTLRVDTDSGVKILELTREAGKVTQVRVDMGPPSLEPGDLPLDADGKMVDAPLEVDGRTWTVTCVSMGNPHCITFDEDPDPLDLTVIGPKFEHHPLFPDRINTEFVRVDSPTHLTMRVWERGSGETMACGTGACAVAVAAALTGRAERSVTVALRGGDLAIDVLDDTVMMTGPTVEVFSASVQVDPEAGTIS